MNQVDWCIEQHRKSNHFYGGYLPYEFHLRMVYQVALDFCELIPDDLLVNNNIMFACYGHDLIEDARVSYNDCKKALGEISANIIFALTNDKGKSRSERAGDKYYEGIRNTQYADFVKLCDRIANVQYSKMTKSVMLNVYERENEKFINYIGNNYPKMNDYLNSLFIN